MKLKMIDLILEFENQGFEMKKKKLVQSNGVNDIIIISEKKH